MKDKLEIYRYMIDASLEGRTQDFLDCCTEDVEYHYHVTTRPLLGKEWVKKFLLRYQEICADAELEVLRHAENGNCLFVEGYEAYTDRRSGKRIAHPFMGIVEFRDGKVCGWRDYFEMNHSQPDEAA